MKVLFLGGPWDRQHHDVPDYLPHALNIMPPEVFSVEALVADEPWPVLEPPVLYTLRRQRNELPVYVASGWPPPPKNCVVAGCPEQARMVFTAAEPGRLAGRDWRLDDEIDLCPPHGLDVIRAQDAYGVDQLAEWLRPEVRAHALRMRAAVRPGRSA